TFMNQAGARLAGVPAEALLGQRPWDVIPAIAGPSFVEAYERSLRDKVQVAVEEYFPPLDRWFEAQVFPLASGVSVYTRDVTEKKRAERLRERLAMHT